MQCFAHTVWVYHVTLTSQILRRTELFYFGLEISFISSSFLMKHGAVYAAYSALSPVFQRTMVSGLVSSNTSMNLFSKCINIVNSRSIIKTGF